MYYNLNMILNITLLFIYDFIIYLKKCKSNIKNYLKQIIIRHIKEYDYTLYYILNLRRLKIDQIIFYSFIIGNDFKLLFSS